MSKGKKEIIEASENLDLIEEPKEKVEKPICDKCAKKYGSRICKSCIEYGGK